MNELDSESGIDFDQVQHEGYKVNLGRLRMNGSPRFRAFTILRLELFNVKRVLIDLIDEGWELDSNSQYTLEEQIALIDSVEIVDVLETRLHKLPYQSIQSLRIPSVVIHKDSIVILSSRLLYELMHILFTVIL